MKEEFSIATAKALAYKLHQGQLDKAGNDYFTHHLADVVERLPKYTNSSTIMAAWLHDSLEDTDVASEELLKLGVPDNVIKIIEELTYNKLITRKEYIEKMSFAALKVKQADNESNGDERRLSLIQDPESRSRLRTKYAKEKIIIENAIENIIENYQIYGIIEL